MRKPCPRYTYELSKLRNSTKYNASEVELFKYLTEHTGKQMDDILAVEFLHNTLEIEEIRGLRLPEWTKPVYPEPLRTMAAKSLAIFTDNILLKRLRAGPLIKDLINHMVDKSRNTLKPDRKMFLYSGHDITLVSVMRALGVPHLYKPDPNSALIIELHRSETNEQHFVEVFYLTNATLTKSLVPIRTTCPQPCSLPEFIESMSEVVPNDWDQECIL